MKFHVTWAIAKVLERERQARGYSLNNILDLIEAGSPKHVISRSSVERIFRGEYSTTEDTFTSLVRAMGLNRQQILAEASKLINWWKVCRDKFTNQPPLSISHLLSGDGFIQQRESVYFAPDLILHSQPVHHSRSERHQLPTKQVNSSQRFSLKQFKKLVLQPHVNEDTYSPARVVLLGEAGVGKTMLLRDIAAWVFAHESRGVVIQVFLNRLDSGETIKDYIFNPWLNQALGKHTVSEADRQQLTELLQEKTVWLLVDGVDEVAQNGFDLLKLSEQLDETFAKVNIVLTCRLSVWELESNSFRTKFHTVYQVQPLDPGTGKNLGQVGQFIKKYLPKLLAEQLIHKLQEPKYAATRTLATNPLLLTLLCYACHRWQKQGGLPNTKARLYEKFVEYLYSSKPELAIPGGFQQYQFNRALGLLAFRALDETNSPYRLTHSFVQRVWRESNLDPKQLHFLKKIGFLSEVGVAQEVPDERVYRFLHPSLQEYFAASVIDDYQLLVRTSLDQSSLSTTDRALQQKWHGVYLFFMGNDSIDKQQKEALLQALINRDNYCNDYYYHSAVCLAAQGIAEFRNSRLGDFIVQQVVDWSLEGWDLNQRTRNYYSIPRTSMAARTLALSDLDRVVAHLKLELQASQLNGDRTYVVAAQLGNLEQGKALAIPELIRLLQFDSELIRDNSAQLLSELAPAHPVLREYLSTCLSSSNYSDQLFAVSLLHKIGYDTAHLIEVVAALYEATDNINTRNSAAWMLCKLDKNHRYAASKPELEEVDKSSSIPITQLTDWLEHLELGEKSQASCQIIYQLFVWVRDTQNLTILLKDEEQIVQLVRVLQRWLNSSSYQAAFESLLCNQALYHCAQIIPHTVFFQGWSRAETSS
jgi:type II secretory pathway predicted ATPase ExeA